MVAANRNGVERASKLNALINTPAPIHPNEPNKRILENSLVGSLKFSNEIELVSDMVGMKQMV